MPATPSLVPIKITPSTSQHTSITNNLCLLWRSFYWVTWHSDRAEIMKVGNKMRKIEKESFLSNMEYTFRIFRLLGYFPIKHNKNLTEFKFAPISFCFGLLCWLGFFSLLLCLHVKVWGASSTSYQGKLFFSCVCVCLSTCPHYPMASLNSTN